MTVRDGAASLAIALVLLLVAIAIAVIGNSAFLALGAALCLVAGVVLLLGARHGW